MAQPYYLFSFPQQHRPPPQPPDRLSQLLCRLHLLLGNLFLGHDGHPWRYGARDGLLGHVVVVNEGKETPTAPRSLRGVVVVHASRHAAPLLFKGQKVRFDLKYHLDSNVNRFTNNKSQGKKL